MKKRFITFSMCFISLISSLAQSKQRATGDVNGDGMVDIQDVTCLVEQLKTNQFEYVTLYDCYKITVTSENEEYGTVSGGGTIGATKSATLAATPKDGYKFDGWYNNATLLSSANPYIFIPTSDMQIIGKFSIENSDDPAVTGDATNITSYSATITAYANNILDSDATDLKIGIIYCTEGTPSKSNGTQQTVSKSYVSADGKYTVNLTGLSENTTYNYRSFVYQSGLYFYGTVKSFTTSRQQAAVSFMTGEASSITCFSAKISAQMTIDSSSDYSTLSYGIAYGTTEETTSKLVVTSLDASGNFIATLHALSGNTTYYYRPYANIDGTIHYGDLSLFCTLSDNVVETGEMDNDCNIKSKLTIKGGAYTTLTLGLCWSTNNPEPTAKNNHDITDEVDDDNCYSINVIDHGTIYYRAYVLIDGVAHYGTVKSITKDFKVGYVDLGLSVKWANCNIGAAYPEEYGDYFAWGETTPRLAFSWSLYTLCDGSESTITKYCTSTSYGKVDNKTTLDLEDDAAYANWGGNWRMPTKAEQNELRYNCTWTWAYQNGAQGYKVTSKTNGNFIFIPTAGYRNSNGLYSESSGGYWSSSLNQLNHAYYMSFDSTYANEASGQRYYGRSVRAVCP